MSADDQPIYVLTIAHPDDESMFFVPTISNLTKEGNRVWLLCLTTGDYDGLGKEREIELVKAGRLLRVERILIHKPISSDGDATDNTSILDHPTRRWSIAEVSDAIRLELTKELFPNKASTCTAADLTTLPNLTRTTTMCNHLILITFDEMGVSGHVNHIDTYYGVRNLVLTDPCSSGSSGSYSRFSTDPPCNTGTLASEAHDEITIEAWTLESQKNIFKKYIPLFEWILFVLSLIRIFSESSYIDKSNRTKTLRACQGTVPKKIYRCHQPWMNWSAMATHKTQFVWYRRLFVVFSCYTFVNYLNFRGKRKMKLYQDKR